MQETQERRINLALYIGLVFLLVLGIASGSCYAAISDKSNYKFIVEVSEASSTLIAIALCGLGAQIAIKLNKLIEAFH